MIRDERPVFACAFFLDYPAADASYPLLALNPKELRETQMSSTFFLSALDCSTVHQFEMARKIMITNNKVLPPWIA
jgi:hypothetical protein